MNYLRFPFTRHDLKCRICALIERKAAVEDILTVTPPWYGDVLTYDHLNFLFDYLYEHLRGHSYLELCGELLFWVLRWSRRVDVVPTSSTNGEV